MTRILALCGKKGSGKDLMASMLTGCRNIKFADPIKDMSRVMFKAQGVSGKDIEKFVEGEWKEDETDWLNGKSCRYLQQVIGTEMGRELISDSIWCDIAERAITSTKGYVIVTDMRFPNEFAMLKRLGATTVRIKRDLIENQYSAHESEKYIDTFDVDYEIDNNGTVSDLQNKVSAVVKVISFEDKI